jgi:hypothetical protein
MMTLAIMFVIMLGPKLFCIYQEYFKNSTNHDLKEIIQVDHTKLDPLVGGLHSSYQLKEWLGLHVKE